MRNKLDDHFSSRQLPARCFFPRQRPAPINSKAPFPELMATGSPGSIGFNHGRRFRSEIGHNVAFYDRWLGEHTQQDSAGLRQQARRYKRPLAQYAPAILEEMEGIAKGAKTSLDEILMINARTDLLVTGHKIQKPLSEPGCTALALLSDGRDRLALGQNWDWRRPLRENTCVLRLSPSDGTRVVTFTEAGMVGKIGMGEHHVGVCLNFLSHKTEREDAPCGVPIHVLLRMVMSCRSLEAVNRLMATLPRSASANFLVGEHRPSSEPRAWNFELTPTQIGIAKLSNGRSLFHTNHFIDPRLADGCGSGHNISTMTRFQQANRLLTVPGDVDDPVRQMQVILADRTGAPYSISRTPGEKSPTETLAGVVMDLSRNRIHLAKGPTHENQFVELPGV